MLCFIPVWAATSWQAEQKKLYVLALKKGKLKSKVNSFLWCVDVSGDRTDPWTFRCACWCYTITVTMHAVNTSYIMRYLQRNPWNFTSLLLCFAFWPTLYYVWNMKHIIMVLTSVEWSKSQADSSKYRCGHTQDTLRAHLRSNCSDKIWMWSRPHG